jgi:hypothetical protein
MSQAETKELDGSDGQLGTVASGTKKPLVRGDVAGREKVVTAQRHTLPTLLAQH